MFTPLNATQIKSNLRKSYLGENWEFLYPWYIILKKKKKKESRESQCEKREKFKLTRT